MERSILLKAQHLAGVLNTIADDESQVMKDRCDWQLRPRVFHLINKKLGPLELDLFASWLTHQLPRTTMLETGSGSHRCVHSELGQVQGICQPPMETDWQGSGTDTPKMSRACSTSSSVEGTGMVPSATGDAGETTTPDSPEEGSGHSRTPGQPPRGGPPTCCVGYLRQRCRACQISERATKLLLAS